jgi:hypothetical protein
LLLDDGSLTAIYDSYQPKPFFGPTLLLTTAVSVRRCADPDLGWSRPPGVEWRSTLVPGQHGNIMFDQNAPFVGRALAAAMTPGGLTSVSAE